MRLLSPRGRRAREASSRGGAAFWALGIPRSSVGHILTDSTPGRWLRADSRVSSSPQDQGDSPRRPATLPRKGMAAPGVLFAAPCGTVGGRARAVVSAEAPTARHVLGPEGPTLH